MKHVQTLPLVRELATLSEVDDLVEAVRQYAFPELVPNAADPLRVEAIRITVEGADLWDLRDNLEYTKGEVDAYSHIIKGEFSMERELIEGHVSSEPPAGGDGPEPADTSHD